MSLFYGEEFIRNALKATPLPYAILAGIGFWLGLAIEPRMQRRPRFYLISFFISVVCLFILSIATMIPPNMPCLPIQVTASYCQLSSAWSSLRL